jgi:hypothetical protein
MSPDDQRRYLRIAVSNAMEHQTLQRYDPFELGALKDMALRIWTNSRGVSQVQQVALCNLLRDIADAIESRRR